MESTLVVSAVLEDFYRANSIPFGTLNADGSQRFQQPQDQSQGTNWTGLVESCTVLRKLIHNATVHSELKYRRIRLQNPRIQASIVSVPGALDILGLAGFARSDEEETVLVFTDSPKNRELCSILMHSLETKLTQLEQMGIGSVADPCKKVSESDRKPPSTAGRKSDDAGPFLSEAERQRRQASARAARKAKAAERTRALRAWKEDEEDRKIKALRRESALSFAATTPSKDTPMTGPLRFADLRIQKLAPSGDAATSAPENSPGVISEVGSTQEPFLQENTGLDSGSSSALSLKAAPASTVIAATEDTEAMDISQSVQDAASSSVGAQKMEASGVASSLLPASVPQETDKAFEEDWKEYLKSTPLCAPAEGIRESSVFNKKHNLETAGGSSPKCLRKLFKELETMNDSLPSDPRCSVFVRFDEETPQFLRAMIPAALPGPTPYSGGLFVFDIYVPGSYPTEPPKVELLTTGGGTVRFGPNLYANGKVCLSLLGTWSGPKWRPNISTLNQVLISIQGLILGAEHPYYLEPGHGGWEGTVKEGSFQRTGHLLKTGGIVHEDFVPRHVAIYENKLRIGTVRYAMLDMLKMVLNVEAENDETKEANEIWKDDDNFGIQDGDDEEQEEDISDDEEQEEDMDETQEKLTSSSSSSAKYLGPFARPIWLHFYQNQSLILKEVQSWTRDNSIKPSFFGHSGACAMEDDEGHDRKHSKLLDKISSLNVKLEGVLSRIETPPMVVTESSTSVRDVAMRVTSLSNKRAAADKPSLKAPPPGDENDKETKPVALPPSVVKNKKITCIDDVRQQIEDAAAMGNYVRAGKLQEGLHHLEFLNERMEAVAGERDYIRAGRLQEQINARIDILNDDEALPQPKVPPVASAVPLENDESWGEDDGHSNDDDSQKNTEFYDDGYGDAFNSDNNWNDSWGMGTTINTSSGPNHEAAKKPAVLARSSPYKSKRSSGSTCRLKIRLPGDPSSITEEFDGEDKLSDLYEHIEKFVDPEFVAQKHSFPGVAQSKHVMTPHGPQMIKDPAFARPLSLKGFTLLLALPKREFSLEAHGTKSLKELGLAPSATLTVMMCTERGMVRRGDLESRLSEAQGDAMDVDGLTYEGLLELTERVGRKVNETWTDESKAKLESNSSLISPAKYLSELDKKCCPDEASSEGNSINDRRCPICLGDFDADTTEENLRQLHSCQHVFHVACLDTWLQTKACCPLCNQDVMLSDEPSK